MLIFLFCLQYIQTWLSFRLAEKESVTKACALLWKHDYRGWGGVKSNLDHVCCKCSPTIFFQVLEPLSSWVFNFFLNSAKY